MVEVEMAELVIEDGQEVNSAQFSDYSQHPDFCESEIDHFRAMKMRLKEEIILSEVNDFNFKPSLFTLSIHNRLSKLKAVSKLVHT
jgi:hypothetical protein